MQNSSCFIFIRKKHSAYIVIALQPDKASANMTTVKLIVKSLNITLVLSTYIISILGSTFRFL